MFGGRGCKKGRRQKNGKLKGEGAGVGIERIRGKDRAAFDVLGGMWRLENGRCFVGVSIRHFRQRVRGSEHEQGTCVSKVGATGGNGSKRESGEGYSQLRLGVAAGFEQNLASEEAFFVRGGDFGKADGLFVVAPGDFNA